MMFRFFRALFFLGVEEGAILYRLSAKKVLLLQGYVLHHIVCIKFYFYLSP